MNFVHQGIRKLSSARHTYRQTDTHSALKL